MDSFITTLTALGAVLLPVAAVLTLLGGVLVALGSHNFAVSVIGSIIIFFGFNLWVPITYSWSTENYPTRARTTGFALVDGIGHLGGGVGMIVIAPLLPSLNVMEAMLLIGAFRGWLMPLGADTLHWGFLAVLVAAVAGVLIVIPTGGEIPVILALTAVGVGAGTAGALLITLPALSLPSMVMVGRALSWRVTLAMAGVVAIAGLAGGLLLWLLRLSLAPASTLAGFRAWALDECPTAPGRRADHLAPVAVPAVSPRAISPPPRGRGRGPCQSRSRRARPIASACRRSRRPARPGRGGR